MNREIKFRAFDTIHEKFVYWCFEKVTNSFIFHTNGQGMWIYGNFSELMQYTGLRDKNGVEIYEGDILKDINYKYIMKFISNLTYDSGGCEHSGFYPIYKGEDEDEDDTYLDLDYHRDARDMEIIGNIYENKELLNNE